MKSYGAIVLAGLTILLAFSGSARAQLVPEWTARHSATTGFIDLGVATAVDQSGNIYVTSATGDLTSTDIITIKYAPDGTELWTAIHPGDTGREFGTFIGIDSSGNVIVIGRVGSDFGVIKYDPTDGSELWAVQHDAGGTDQPNAAAIDDAGNIYVTGQSWADTQNDFYTVKFSSGGVLQWTARYDGPGPFLFAHDVAHAIAVDKNGDVFVTGGSNGSGSASPDYLTIKYSGATGTQLWLKRYAGAGANDEAFDLVLDSAGDVYVTGGSFQSGWKYVTIKYSNIDGAQLWLATDNPQVRNVATDIALDGSGGVVITGWSDPDGDESNFNENITTVKHRASDGALLWSKKFGSDAVGTFDVPHDVIIDSEDNIFVSGENSGLFILLQYDPLSGEIDDMDTFQSGPTEYAAGKALALDSSQNIIIGGVARNVNTENRDILTVKYPSQSNAIYELIVSNLVGGEDAVLTIRNATPFARQYIFYSIRGFGSTPVPKLGIVLDLENPRILAAGFADDNGAFETTIPVPAGAFGHTVWFQVAENRRTTEAFSQIVR